MASSGELNQNSLSTLRKHLEAGEFANAEDMNVLKKLIDYEVNWRRHQNYALTTEIAQSNKQFDTAKYINNLIGGLRKIHKQKFQLVTQNITFINAIFDIVRKLEVLMSYKEHTQYSDNAGCDGECRGLCSSCASGCTGGDSCNFRQSTGSGSGSYIQEYTGGGCSTNCTGKFSCVVNESGCATQCPGYSNNGKVYVYYETSTQKGFKGEGNGKAVPLNYSETYGVKSNGQVYNQITKGTEIVLSTGNGGTTRTTVSSITRNAGGVVTVHYTNGGFSYGGSCGSQSSVQARSGWNPGAYNGGCACKNWSH